MAGNFDFTAGLPDWFKKIKAFMDANEYRTTPWSNTGITFLNGFSDDKGSGSLMYRTIDVGDTHTLELCGWVHTPPLTKSQRITAIRLPVSVMQNGKRVDFNNICWWGDRWAKLELNTATGEINLINMDPDVGTPAGGMAFNARYSW